MNESSNKDVTRCIEKGCDEVRFRNTRCLAHQRKYEREAQRKHRIKIGTGIVPPNDPNVHSGAVNILTWEPDALCTGCGIKLKEASWTVGRQCDICCYKRIAYATKVRLEHASAIQIKRTRKLSKSEVGRLGGIAKSENWRRRQEQSNV